MLDDIRGPRKVPADFNTLNAFELFLGVDIICDFHDGSGFASLAGQDVGLD
jgi:hypothetical protein